MWIIPGVHDNLEYIRDDLKANAIFLNSIFASPNKDFGYDISNYNDVHPDFGTLDDFANLRATMHKRGVGSGITIPDVSVTDLFVPPCPICYFVALSVTK